MAYEKQTWADGDTITAEKLNNIENGIADADNIKFVINKISANTFDKTASEIATAIESGKNVVFRVDSGSGGPTAGVVIDIPLHSYTRNRNASEDPAQGSVSLGGSVIFHTVRNISNDTIYFYVYTLSLYDNTFTTDVYNLSFTSSNE